MYTEYVTRRRVISIFIFMALVCAILFLTYNRRVKQDDGWYVSWVLRWMQDHGTTSIKAYWDYTDTNDADFGCSFIYTLFEGIFFSVFGLGVIGMRALNALEAIALCSMMYLYIRKENRLLGLLTVTALVFWNMFHLHFYNRPELPASIVAMVILYLLSYRAFSKWAVFFAYLLLGVLLDIHPLSLFLVAGMSVLIFLKRKTKRVWALLGGLAGLCLYFAGNYWVNNSFGIFTGPLMGTEVALGDHYMPVFATGIDDILNITAERFTFLTKAKTPGNILKLIAFCSVFGVALYGWATKKLHKSRLLNMTSVTYITFIVLSTLFSEAVSNGFRLYHSIAFGMFYFALLYSIFYTAPIKYIAYIGLVPFIVFAKDAIPQMKINFAYHKEVKYYRRFKTFNDNIPDGSKVLMRPTHAFFNYETAAHFDYTYGLLRYMQKNNLPFKEAVISKDYDYLCLDEQFETEFFTDKPSSIRTSPSPYYYPLRNTGLTSTEFSGLVKSGFLIPIDSLYDAFAGKTVLYKVNN